METLVCMPIPETTHREKQREQVSECRCWLTAQHEAVAAFDIAIMRPLKANKQRNEHLPVHGHCIH